MVQTTTKERKESCEHEMQLKEQEGGSNQDGMTCELRSEES